MSKFVLICTDKECGRKAPIDEWKSMGQKMMCPYCRCFRFVVVDDDLPKARDPYDGLSQEEIDECEKLIAEMRREKNDPNWLGGGFLLNNREAMMIYEFMRGLGDKQIGDARELRDRLWKYLDNEAWKVKK